MCDNFRFGRAAVKEFLQEIRRFVTHTFIAGAILVATGFAPEQWIEKAANSIGIAQNPQSPRPIVIDIRVVLVLIGMVFIIVSVTRNLHQTESAEQKGSIRVRATGEIETFYPVPFTHPPNLNIDQDIGYNQPYCRWEVLEQRSESFKIYITGFGGGPVLSWRAKGVLVEKT
jgi:hypothetical protein